MGNDSCIFINIKLQDRKRKNILYHNDTHTEIACMQEETMASVSTFETILISFLISHSLPGYISLVTSENIRSSTFSENIKQRNIILSERYLLTRQNSKSKLMCAVLCQSNALCKMFRFEAPSVGCTMYREAVTGGCFGLPSPFVSRLYVHRGKP